MNKQIAIILFVTIVTLSTTLVTGKVMAQFSINVTKVFMTTKDPVIKKWQCQQQQHIVEYTKETGLAFGHIPAWNGMVGLYNKKCANITEYINPNLSVEENN